MLRIVGGRRQYVQFQGFASAPGNASVYTINDFPFGDESKDRVLLLSISHYSTQGVVSAVEIGGFGAVKQVESGPNPTSGQWSAVVPVGLNGQIRIFFSGGNGISVSFGLWALHGLVSPLAAFNTDNNWQVAPGQVDLIVPSNGVAVVAAVQRTLTGNPKGITWSGDTLNYETDFTTGAGSSSGASAAKLPNSPIFTVIATPASGSISMSGTTWR